MTFSRLPVEKEKNLNLVGHFIAVKIISVSNISHTALAFCSFIVVYHRIIYS
jgi:hypothetical protein